MDNRVGPGRKREGTYVSVPGTEKVELMHKDAKRG